MAKNPKISASHEPGGLIVHISGLLPSLSPPSSGSPGWSSPTRRMPPGGPSPTSPPPPRPPRRPSSGSAARSAWTATRSCASGSPPRRPAAIEPPDARVVGGDIPPGADLAQIIATIAFNDARAVEETAEQLDPAVCEQVVEAIAGAGRIDIYGAGASGFVASDFQQKLHRIGRTAFYWPDVHTALTSAALLGHGDVAIGISHTGTTADAIEVLSRPRAPRRRPPWRSPTSRARRSPRSPTTC